MANPKVFKKIYHLWMCANIRHRFAWWNYHPCSRYTWLLLETLYLPKLGSMALVNISRWYSKCPWLYPACSASSPLERCFPSSKCSPNSRQSKLIQNRPKLSKCFMSSYQCGHQPLLKCHNAECVFGQNMNDFLNLLQNERIFGAP